jgi:hypothetical protein
MKYPYTSIDPIIADVQDIHTQLNLEGVLDTDKCYSAMVDCIRQIGGNHNNQFSEIITFSGFSERLPLNFYMMEEVWELGEPYGSSEIYDLRSAFVAASAVAPMNYRRKRRLFAGNSATLRYVHPDYAQLARRNDPCYVLTGKPPTITVTQPRMKIGVTFYGLQRDENGQIMMQDEEWSIQAAKYYALLECLRERWIMGKVPNYVWTNLQATYTNAFDKAQEHQKASSEEEQYRFIIAQQQRIDRFNRF